MNIKIDPEITNLTPDFSIGVMTCSVETFKNKELDTLINQIEQEIEKTIDIKDVVNLPIIIDGRNAYKKYGKDPSRYRLATESLYRRLSKGNSLYRINNVVDLGNVLSIRTRKSVAVLDKEEINGEDVLIRLGRDSDEYIGIGRGPINISRIPLYEDETGPFGSVTSDTERTMIRDKTSEILLFLISFSGKDDLSNELEYAKEIYTKYANATNIETYII